MQPKASPDKEATEPDSEPEVARSDGGEGDDDATPTAPGLTAFQLDCLRAVERVAEKYQDEPPHGLALKADLEKYYEKEINHGRLYPNLDDLVDADLVTKGEIDARTNSYRLTEEGTAILDERVGWFGGER